MRRPVAWVLLGVLSGVLRPDAGPAARPQSKRVVVYSAIEERVTTEVVRAFQKQTGIEARVLSLAAAGALVTRIRAERARPRADVFMGGPADLHGPLAREGLLLRYVPKTLAEARVDRQFYDPDHYWHGWYLGVLGILVHRERFAREIAPRGVAWPRTWDDLLDPAYKGHLAVPHAVTTGGGYVFLVTQVFRLGEAAAMAWLKRLMANVSHVVPTAPGVVTLVSRGEAIVGVIWAHEGFLARRMGFPVEVVVPPETGFEVGAVSILRGGPNPQGAQAFVDFLLTRVPQAINATQGLRYPVRPDVSSPAGVPPWESIRLVRYDRAWAIEHRDRLVRRWQAEVHR